MIELQQSPPRTPSRSLLARIRGRAIREVKSAFGIPSYLDCEDRRVLEQLILPYFLSSGEYANILFVGCDWYTEGYNQTFEEKKNLWTIDIALNRRRYGAQQHIVDALQNLQVHFACDSLDLIVCNGVFGWGLDAKADVEQAFSACGECLRAQGILVIGWDDIDERRPFSLQECESLRAFGRYQFPPLDTSEYLTNTPYRHTFSFFEALKPTEQTPPATEIAKNSFVRG